MNNYIHHNKYGIYLKAASSISFNVIKNNKEYGIVILKSDA